MKSMTLLSDFYKIPSEKISIMPNGIDLSFFKIKRSREKKIVFSGVMYYHRGLDILLDTIPRIIDIIRNIITNICPC